MNSDNPQPQGVGDLELAVTQLRTVAEVRGWSGRPSPSDSVADTIADGAVMPFRAFFDGLAETESSPGLLAGFRTVSLPEALNIQREHVGHEPAVDSEHAGTLTSSWSRSFLPLAYQDGDMYLLDLRPGPLHGCARHWYCDDGAVYEPEWPSLANLLVDVRRAINDGATFDCMRLVHDGGDSYHWEPA